MNNPEYGHLLTGAINSIAAYEGKTSAAIETELGARLGVAGSTIQRYKSGQVPPDPQIIETLAAEAVRRAYLNREWLARYLRAARCPASQEIIERLIPSRPQAPQSSRRIYQNLPAPTYNRFVMRSQAYADVLDGLRQRSAVVLVTSLGGMGKTSLAREVAAHCLARANGTPAFDAAVWVSDKGHAGATNLSLVLDEIARTLDYPGLISMAFDDRRFEVEQLLRRQRVLLIIDNFETITDGALLAWLLRLPEPSKALVTSREYHPEFRSSWPVDLGGMNKQEATEFVSNQLHTLRMDTLVQDPAEMDPLWEATGGNPKAILLALGNLKHGHRPLGEVIGELYQGHGDLFDDLFQRSWQLLDDACQRVLLAMTLFPHNASEEALSATAGVSGQAFYYAAEQLADLALLDMNRPNIRSTPRYSLHPLVRAFASARMKENASFASQAYERWVALCVTWAAEVKQARFDLRKLRVVELEQETMEAAIRWCYEHDRHPETARLIDGIGYFYHVRGMWDRKLELHPLAAEIARRHDDRLEELDALIKQIQLLSRQAKVAEAEIYLPRLRELAAAGPLPDDLQIEYLSAESFYLVAQDKIDQVEQIWLQHHALSRAENGYLVRSWLADCLLARRDWAGAAALLAESLHEVTERQVQRGMIAISVKLIAIYLEQGCLPEAAAALEAISHLAADNLDRRYMAFIQSYYARFYTLQNNLPAARAAYHEAIDLFERMGMRRQLARVRLGLQALDEMPANPAEPDLPRLP